MKKVFFIAILSWSGFLLGTTIGFQTTSSSGDESTSSVSLTLVLDAAAASDVTVNYTLNNSSTVLNYPTTYYDINLPNGTATISAGNTSTTITFTVTDDSRDEDNETVIIDIYAPTNATLDPAASQATYTIIDNDDPPTISFSTSSSNVDEDSYAVLTVNLSKAAGKTVTADWSLSDVSTSNSDYNTSSGSISISEGSTEAQIWIWIYDDNLDEPTESFQVSLSNIQNATAVSPTSHQVNINDINDPPSIGFSTTSATRNESDGSVSVFIDLSQASGKDVSVNYTVSGTADGGNVDHDLSNGTASITAGNTSTSLTFNIIDDALDEDDETIVLALTSPTYATLGSNDTMTVTITDNDALPFVAFSSASSSGTESSSPATFAVALSTTSGRTVQVNYTVSGITATGGGTDYTLADGTLTFNAGETSKNISAVIVDDALDEADETFKITLSNSPSNADLGTNNTHTYTILDNDLPPSVGFSASTSTYSEGDGQGALTVALSAASGKNISFDYAATGGTATSGSDYTFTAGTATISAGNTDTTIHVTLIDDSRDETDSETITFALSNVSNASNGTLTHTMTITDNDNAPTVEFRSATGSGNESASPVNLTVHTSAISDLDVSVQYAVTTASTATGGGTDYTLSSGTLTIPAGDTTGVISFTVNNDALDENDETVVVQLSSPTNSTIGTNGTFTYTINDDDNPPTVAFTSTSGTGAENTANVSIPVQLSAVSGLDVSVDYSVKSTSTATGGGTDYTLADGTLTISAGSTSGTIDLVITDDSIDENSETVVVQLSSTPTNATIGTNAIYTYTITDNDNPPSIAFSTATAAVAENAGSYAASITLSAVSGLDIDVDYAVTAGDATGSGTDYTLNSGTATITAGNSSTTLTISITDDSMDERDETLTVTLSNPVNASIGADTTFTLTIQDNDNPAKIAFQSSGTAVVENVTPATVTVALSAVSGVTASVDYAVTGGTATSPDDYSLSAGTLTITPGNTTATFDVTIQDDILDEDAETVIIALSNPDSADLGTQTTYTLTIQDNDTPPTVQLSSSSQAVAENAGTANFQLELSAVSGRDVYVDYTYTENEALGGGVDFTLSAGTDTIPAGATTSNIPITIVDDALDEDAETMRLDLSSATNATLSGNTSNTLTINDDDPLPTLGFAATTASGNENAGTVTLTVSLLAESGRTVTADYAIADGTTDGNGTDYTFTNGTLTFAAGETSKTLSLTLVDDGLDEDDETVYLVLSNESNATLGNDTLTYTILDNDDPPSIAFDVLSSTGNENVDSVYLDLSLSAASGKSVSVDYSVGSASTATGSSVDYTLPAGTVTLPAGATADSILLVVIDDHLDEDNETVVVELASSPTNATLGTNATHTYTIIDNDASPAAFTVGSVRATGSPSLVGYYNNSNTGVRVRVPIASDPLLEGGQVQIRARAVGSSSYTNVGSAYTILSSDLNDSAEVTITETQFESFSDYAENARIQFTAVISDIYGNSTTGTRSSETLMIDTTPPTVFSTGTFSATGGTETTGYWNGTNTDLSASVQIPNDTTLIGGYVYLLMGVDDANYSQIGDSVAILLSDLNTSKSLTAPAADVNNHPAFQPQFVGLWLNSVIIDRAGNQRTGTVSSTTLQIDTQSPGIISVSSPTPDQAYNEGDTILVNLNCDDTEQMYVTGTPRLTLETGTVDATIDYFSGSGTSSIQFRYIVSALENTADLNYASTSALSLNGGTIRDVGGNDLNLTLPDPASANSLAGNKDIVIDTQAPAAALSYSDSLVRFEDGTVTITATFTDSMSLDSLPKITVTFPGSGSPDVDAAPMVFDAGDTWHYVLSLIDNVNGTIQVSVTGKDKALNDLPGSSVSGGNVLRIDTTDPVLSAVSPDTGSYINHKRIGWTLSESLVSGSVTFTRLSGGGSTVTAALAGTELDAGIRPPAELTHTADLALVDGTVYRLTISGVDSAGNTGTVNLDDITYDTTPPTASLSYDQYYASSDTTVLITATFSEPMLPVPLISVDFAGVGQDITDQAMTIGTDSTEWTYALAIPTGTANNGIASVSLSATDLAANPLSNGDVTGRDTLMVDNSAPSVSFSYANLSQPRLSASGKGGDQIRVTATFSEVTKNAPAPLLSVNYGDTTVTGIVNSGTQGDSVWTFDFTLLSTVTAERYLTVSVTAEDLAGNAITTATNDQAFFLDNLAPADFATGDVTTTGYNPVPGWINGRTDSIYVVVPLASSDNTLLFGGQVEIQMSIPARMGSGNWAIVGSNDSITQVGNRSFGRAYSEVVTAFANLGSPITFAQGDTIYTRAVVYDQVGNNTGGQISARSLIYDVAAPTIGSITGGNIFSSDTLVSTDSITVQWSEFIDPSPSTASGTAYYEVGVEHVGDTPLLTFMDWDSVGLATIGRYRLPLQHNEHYRVHIRAFDQAGNISDTLVSNSILRLNSPPVLAAIDSQQVDEDVKFQYRVRATDIDSTTLLGESLHFTVLDTGIVHPNHNITIDDVTGVVVWNTPLQQDTGRYTIRIGVRDNWGFADTTDLILTVNSVNDTPVVVIPPPANQVIFIEDHTDLVQLNLTPYATDVDNDSTQITWQAVILDTTTKNGYPLGRVISGPGTDPRQDQLLSRQYSGWTDPGKGGVSPQSLGEMTLPFAQKITVTIDTIQGSTIATFDADTNYYGANHRILFYASDPQGATAMDTVFLTVLPDNDPPVIAAIPDTTVLENDSLRLDFADWVTDVDDTLLTFSVTALTNGSHMTLTPSTFTSTGFGDSVLLKPQSLWSDSALIQLIVTDSYATADTALFVLDIIRVPRPALGIAVIQNNAFTNYYDIVVTDTLEKVVSLSLTVQNEPVSLDTAGFFTYVGRYQFVTAGTYTFQVYAQGVVGDTLVSRDVGLALARVLQPWSGFSSDGRLKISGDPGVVAFDQSVMIFDSTMMDPHKARKACYRVGHPGNLLDGPAQVALQSDDEHQAVYWSADGVAWEELPSISEEGTVKAWTEKWGYYKLGERTIIVPGMTSIANSYPNPFNPVTTLEYNIGFADGPNQVVEISVYNLLGQHIRTLLKGYQPIGRHTIQWNGRDQQGQTVASGVYFIQLQTNKGRIKSRKVMLLR